MKMLLFFLYIVSISAQDCEGENCQQKPADHTYLTYGSTFKLRHMMSGVRVHSSQVTYGMGSGQQAITGNPELDDVGSLWVVHCADKKCISGFVFYFYFYMKKFVTFYFIFDIILIYILIYYKRVYH